MVKKVLVLAAAVCAGLVVGLYLDAKEYRQSRWWDK